ncbi:MAG TPA: hypothetical protein PKW75_05410 [candidate division Zixibacteria bacterium]|nr:hypothetical protein [candidate division Zixibacteria bacterium]MDD4916553.1 hypothetical protein [candidate division Zixibacteria bacterium]MDM7974251.1 hypothetical protein [candidate division Zixibacteria bacterium]HOD65740.1 hypothetical protein [candidate division Zixibacteria bacterium]HOZ07705.1 hypothetical protein [candidate division Zixibacteria bacterium]
MISLVALGLMVIGIVLLVLAYRRQRPDAPRLGSVDAHQPRTWRPVWRQRHLFAEKRGFVCYLIGATLIVSGGMLGAVFVF